MKIAVVDDNKSMREAVSYALGDLGYRDVRCYSGPDEFLGAYGTNPNIDLVITEMEMEGRSGIKMINELPPDYTCGVVVMTRRLDRCREELGKYPGTEKRIDVFLEKPITKIRELEEAVKRALSSKG